MSSYFDDASLVMIPSGYKDQKVYSVKPLDGSGDLTFSRASSATRVASNGLIEKVRTNVVLYSQAFDNAAWNQNASPTITANTTVAPDGTTTADTIAATGSFSGVYQSFGSVNNATEYSWSVYIKNISSASNIFLGVVSNPSTATLNFDATTGTIIGTGGSITGSSVTNVGNGWYRLSGTYVSTGTTTDFAIYGIGVMSFAAWGAQLETGVTTDYIATTTAAVSVGPVSGLPRLDYLNSTCPRLLLEPQRTNKITYSENQGPTGTNWYPSTTWTVTNNSVTSPDGYTDADTLTEDTSTGFHSSYFNATIDNSYTGTYTISAFAKYNGRLFVLSPKGSAQRTYFNLQTGTVAQAGTGVTASIVNYGNGWYRCICTATFASENVNFEHMLATAVGTLQYTGNGTSGVHIWGCMAEAGAYATSYIPTLGTSVTRVADAASKTGISSLIGQTEGTLFFDMPAQNFAVSNFQTLFIIYNNAGLASKYFHLYKTTGGTQLTFEVFNSTLQCGLSYVMTQNTRYKIAAVYKDNRFELWVNGVLRSSDTVGTIGTNTYDTLEMAYDSFNSNSQLSCSQALLFKTALTQAQLAELTTL